MQPETMLKSDDLKIEASENSSPRDFDFLFGKWKIRNRKLKTRLQNSTEWTEFEAAGECRGILNGFGNIDSFCAEFGGNAFEG